MKKLGKLARLWAAREPPKTSVPKKHYAFYLKIETYERFRAACQARGIPMSHVIESFIEAVADGALEDDETPG